MTSYEGFPGHDDIRAFMEAQQTDVSISSSISTPTTSPNSSGHTSSSAGIPCAPPCSLSGSSENLATPKPNRILHESNSVTPKEPRHQCSICQKRFHHWASLNAHELVHSGKTSRVERLRGKHRSPKTPSRRANTSSGSSPEGPALPRPMIPLSSVNRSPPLSGNRRHHYRRLPSSPVSPRRRFDVSQTPIPTMTRRRQRTLVHSSSARPGRVVCEQCGKFYSSKTKLRVHQMKRHSRELQLLLYI